MARNKEKKDANSSKGVCTDATEMTPDSDMTTSESDEVWKTPSKLKEEVQTIIDIMGPTMSPKFNYNTSSEADNEESVFSNSKFSTVQFKARCDCNDDSEKTDAPDILSKADDTFYNTTSNSATVDENTDPKISFQCEESFSPSTQYICPPPLVPANFGFNSECLCPQMASMLHNGGVMMGSPFTYEQDRNLENPKYVQCAARKKTKSGIINWLRNKVPSTHKYQEPCDDNSCEYYKMNMKRNRGDDNSLPRRVIFDLVEGIPPKEDPSHLQNCFENCSPSKEKKNNANEKIQEQNDPVYYNECGNACHENDLFLSQTDCPKVKKTFERATFCDIDGKTRVDVYYFDHGCFSHYRTTDAPPMIHSEELAFKTERYTTIFWAEIFGAIHIGFSFVTSFLLQFFRFILYSIFRPLTIGLVQLASDYFFKPLLATLFNGIFQPILIFVFNIAASLRDLCSPIAEAVGFFLQECAGVLKAIRLVEINKENSKDCSDVKSDNKRPCKKSKPVC
ncbi:uncharacterized protein LOC115889659 [Sitophilus oryzae]|uniref:Uncharacterized protein LOC115889659 n=1 Tax=Sitophilus oryzae TaxID=7048 RepID=A0A6J2YQN4_SITOR|nr:uncharacterized protein LOC115889659 [Sitophilus oryzae]